MRIAFVCADPGIPVFGHKGCSIHVQELVRAFHRLGATVDLFAAKLGGEAPRDLAKLRVFQIPLPQNGANKDAVFGGNRKTVELLNQTGRHDLVYERYSLWSFAAMRWALDSGIPGMLEVNAPLVEEQAQHRGLTNRHWAERVREKVFRDAGAIVSVSDEVKSHVDRFVSDKRRVHVVMNGVDPSRFSDTTKPLFKGPKGSFTVGFLGTLKPWHGLRNLVDAFVELRRRSEKYRLLIVGDGPERSRIEQDLRESSVLDSVLFTGAVSPDDVPGWLASMDAAVAPYPNEENFYFSPLKLFEYMAARLPAIVSRIGQIQSVIEDGVNGVLVPPGDPFAIARAIEKLDADKDLRFRLGRAARLAVEEKHTWAVAAQRILTIAGDLRQQQHVMVHCSGSAGRTK